MLQQFYKDLRLHKNGLLLISLGLVCAAAFGMVLVAIIMHTEDDPGTWFCMGTLIASLVLMMLSLFTSAWGYPQEFMLALSMGRTRKDFLFSYYLRMMVQLILGWAVILLLHQIELRACTVLYPQYENEIYFSFLTDWRVLVPVFLLLPILSMFLGALYSRHGKKGLFVFYLVWMFCCFILPRMFDQEEPSEGVLDQVAMGLLYTIQVVPVGVWLGFGVITVVFMAAATIKFGMEQMVK